jgi:hypothetical protein
MLVAGTELVVLEPHDTSHLRGPQAHLLVVAAAVLLVVYGFGIPRLTIDRAAEAPATSRHASATAADTKPPFDVDAAIEKGGHAVTPVAGTPGAFEVHDPGYRATFDPRGYSFTPAGAIAGLSTAFAGIRRGSDLVAVDVGPWRATGNVARRGVADGISERVTGRDGEVEWDFVLTDPPPGTGPLTIRADLTGVVGDPTPVAAGTAWRLRLAGGTTVELGETAITDATGAELHRALPTITDGHIELVVPADVLANAIYPVVVDPVVSGAVPVATGSLINDPSVASDGSTYVVVWTQESSGDFNIYGARVSADGTLVQPIGKISNTTAGKSSILPDVAWNGSEYLVVWQFNYATDDVDVYAQRVSATGSLVGGTIIVSQPSANQQHATVAAAGGTFYVAWEDTRAGNSGIYGGRVASGSPLDGDGVAVVNGTTNESVPDVAWNGTNFLVAYQYEFTATDNDVHARLVSSSAVPVGSVTVISGGTHGESSPAVTSNGADYLVVWQDTRNNATTGTDIYGALVGASGSVTTGGIEISKTAGEQSDPAVAYNGAYLVAWLDRRAGWDLYATRVDGAGAVKDKNGLAVAVVASDDFTPAVARGPGNKWAVDYESFDGSTSHVVHRTVAPK